jgi:hypothetical protein
MRSSVLTFLGFIAILLSCPGIAQTEVPTIESMPEEGGVGDSLPWPTLKVRIEGDIVLIDSLWSDSLWQWSSGCDRPSLTIRFENNGWYKEQSMPCEITASQTDSILPESNSTLFFNASESNTSKSKLTYSIAMKINRSDLDSLPNLPLKGRCFPLVSSGNFQRWFDTIRAIPFESDKCRAIASRQHQNCLTTSQAASLLSLIPSEDRKLSALEHLIPHIDRVHQLSVDALFHLQLFREKARKLIE